MNKTLLERAMTLFQTPFRYDEVGGLIFDANNKIVIYAGEWGEVQEYRQLHAELGRWIAEMMNQGWKRQDFQNGYLDSDSEETCQEELQKKLVIEIGDLDFSSTTIEACRAVGIRVVNDFMSKSTLELESGGFNPDSIMEVELTLETLGLYMGMSLP